MAYVSAMHLSGPNNGKELHDELFENLISDPNFFKTPAIYISTLSFKPKAMRNKISVFLSISILIGTASCNKVLDVINELKDHDKQPQVTTFATGLTAPLGVESDAKGQLWVTEAGTGRANDGQLSLITPQGIVYPVVEGFPSVVSPEGAVFGLNHLLLKDGVLYMLHGTEGKLYKFDVSSFTPGDAPVQASDLQYEDIGTFVKAYAFEDDNNETDIFNLTLGPGGDLFIADAAANAIIRRKTTTGELSVFATIPPIDSSGIQAVPTGIVFDGRRFLVCTFTGYPYPARKATIYQVDLNGNTSVYQTGLSTLTDIELGINHKPVVLEYGTWTGETFVPNSGNIVRATPQKNTPVVTGLNFPNSIKRSGLLTYYVALTYDGTIQKVRL